MSVAAIALPTAAEAEEGHWTLRAACRGVDPEVFFPVKERDAGAGKRVCSDCPVRNDCLLSAIETGERYGIWGGLSEGDRGWSHGHPVRRGLGALR